MIDNPTFSDQRGGYVECLLDQNPQLKEPFSRYRRMVDGMNLAAERIATRSNLRPNEYVKKALNGCVVNPLAVMSPFEEHNLFLTDRAEELNLPDTVFTVTSWNGGVSVINGKPLVSSVFHPELGIDSNKGMVVELRNAFLEIFCGGHANADIFCFCGPQVNPDWVRTPEKIEVIQKTKDPDGRRNARYWERMVSTSKNMALSLTEGIDNLGDIDANELVTCLDRGVRPRGVCSARAGEFPNTLSDRFYDTFYTFFQHDEGGSLKLHPSFKRVINALINGERPEEIDSLGPDLSYIRYVIDNVLLLLGDWRKDLTNVFLGRKEIDVSGISRELMLGSLEDRLLSIFELSALRNGYSNLEPSVIAEIDTKKAIDLASPDGLYMLPVSARPFGQIVPILAIHPESVKALYGTDNFIKRFSGDDIPIYGYSDIPRQYWVGGKLPLEYKPDIDNPLCRIAYTEKPTVNTYDALVQAILAPAFIPNRVCDPPRLPVLNSATSVVTGWKDRGLTHDERWKLQFMIEKSGLNYGIGVFDRISERNISERFEA